MNKIPKFTIPICSFDDNKDDGLVHGSYDGIISICGINFSEIIKDRSDNNWFVVINHYSDDINCPECLEIPGSFIQLKIPFAE